jgi:hypothetical protein
MLKKTIEAIKNYFFKPTTKVYYLPVIEEIITVTEHKTVEIVYSSNFKVKIFPKAKGIMTYYQLSKENPEHVFLLGDL